MSARDIETAALAPVQAGAMPREPRAPAGLLDVAVSASGRLRAHGTLGAIEDREQLLARLQHLREILPVFATELASARRQAARLRVENKRLVERVRQLQVKATQAPSQRGR